MQLTIDSNEPLDRVLKVVSSLYGVELGLVSTSGETQPAPAKTSAELSAPKQRGRRAGREPSATKSEGATAAPKTAAARQGASRRPSLIDPAAVRKWARAHGYTVSDRGRVSNAVLKAYRESSRATS